MATELEALHAELAGYVAHGRDDRAELVRAEIARVEADQASTPGDQPAGGDEPDVPAADGGDQLPAEGDEPDAPAPRRRR